MKKRRSWTHQLVTIENKGYDAFKAGLKESDNPYGKGSTGGSVQRQRRQAWYRGFEIARNEVGNEVK